MDKLFFKTMGTKTILGGVFLACAATFLVGISPASADTIIPLYTTISGHETWTAANGPYLASSVSVPVGASLTIEPGTVIKGVSMLSVQGTLTVGAAGADKVIFTSWADDAAGGDTNSDGNASTPNEKGDWGGIYVAGSGTATITDTIFKYGGQTVYYAVSSSGTATVSVSNSEFVYGNNAIIVSGGTADVYDNSFHDLYQYGIRQTGGLLRFGRNSFENIKKRTISLEGGTTQSDGGNIGDVVVYFTNRTISSDAVIPNDGFTYHISGVTIASGASLTIEPGAIVKVAGTWPIISHGALIIGSSEESAKQTIITSAYDDSVGVIESSTDRDPFVTGDWGGINLTSGTATIANTAFKYGGISIYASLYNYGAQVSVSHSEFSFGNNAILLEGGGGTTEVYDNAFHDIDQFGIWHKGGALRFGRNTFATPKAQSVYMTAGSLQNDGGNSGTGSIYLSSVTLSEDMILPKDGLPYLFLSLSIPEGRTLGISPGAVVKVLGAVQSSGTLNIGSLDAAAEPVVITSYYDDTVGGDTDRENPVHEPAYDDWSGIAINTGAATIVNTEIMYAGGVYGAQLFVYGGTVLVERVHLQKGGIGIYAAGGTLTLTDSELSEGKIGLKYHGGTVTMHGNSIHGNSEYGVINASAANTELDATDNWWGDASGPKHYFGNTNGLGDRVSDYVLYRPWLTYDPSLHFSFCGDHCYSSILFLPGLEASRLYDGDNQLWEPNREADVEKLFLTDEGKSKESDVYTRDVIDEKNVSPLGQGNIYKSFLSDLANWKSSGFIFDYSVIPYDWRLSFDDILDGGKKDGENISYTNPDHERYIIGELRRLAAASDTKKVTIVAHSNGGLLAKALIKELGDEEAKSLIDNLVLVAVPQSGTPQAIGALLQGYDQGLPFDWLSSVLPLKTARTLAKNMPSAYPLLPSGEYFDDRDGSRKAVVSFEDGSLARPFFEKYGSEIKDVDTLRAFLRDNDGKVDADDDNIYTPSKINPEMLSYGERIQNDLDDDWSLPEGVRVYQIAGIGEDTLESIRYKAGKICVLNIGSRCFQTEKSLMFSPEVALDGDGTVKSSSALAMSDGKVGVEKFWVDLKKYDTFYSFERDHADILEVNQLRDFIKDNILVRSFESLPKYVTNSEPSISQERHFKIFLYSPLALSAKDADGNVVSATTSDIPGARYKRFGEVQYISVPASVHPTVMLDGEAEGSFTLEVKEVSGDTVMVETAFAAIPNTADTQVTMDFPDGTLEHAEPLVINYDGQGEPELSLEPKIGEVVTTEQTDTVAPTTTASFSGIQGTNDWYTDDVAVTLSATDNDGSGVEKTEYSLDNGTTWTAYADPFMISTEGTTTFWYRSIDTAGNQEEAKTETIKIDKTKPVITGTVLPAADANGWNSTDVEVRFVCTDSGAGQSGIETDTVAGSTLASEGKGQSVTNTGACTDKAGNQANPATVSGINIDKTAPEAKISFNSTTQKLDISGTDNLSDVSVTLLEKQELTPANKKVKKIKDWFSHWHGKHKKNLPDMLATITDQAGHVTSLTFEKTKDRNGFIFVRLLSLGYDGDEADIKDTDAQYKWKMDRKGKYQLFASSIKTDGSSLESHYIPRKDETWIMEKSEVLKDDDQDEENDRSERGGKNDGHGGENEDRPIKTKLPGIVIPYLESKKGEINTKY